MIIGGAKGKVYQRIARYGDGWYAPTRSPEDLAPRLEELKKACAEEGRDYGEIETLEVLFFSTRLLRQELFELLVVADLRLSA